MTSARLTALELSRFKSYGPTPVRIPLRPITILVGKNNTGKSSIIQALLLLKQTLEQLRGNDALSFHGQVPVPAVDLRELTHGWPDADPLLGPRFAIEWVSEVDTWLALENAGQPHRAEFAKQSDISWVESAPASVPLYTRLEVSFTTRDKRVAISELKLESHRLDTQEENPSVRIRAKSGGSWQILWNYGSGLGKLQVEWDHFLPILSVDRRNVGPRHSDRGKANGFFLLYDQPLACLRSILENFSYLSSARSTPSMVYQPIGGDTDEVGMSGERAAQVLHARSNDAFHYMPTIQALDGGVRVDYSIREQPLLEAVDTIFHEIGVPSSFSFQEIANIGFTLLFGKASLFHVGRGISYLLPIVELGLLADPLANRSVPKDLTMDEYLARIKSVRHIALEEPESHLHPMVHSRLAHFFVATAHVGRQWLIETHSDHTVRRLRRLAASADKGSAFEKWMCENVSIIEIEQREGVTSATASHITPTGGVGEHWPSDFMDRALTEEDSIYARSMEKGEPASTAFDEGVEVVHDEGDPDTTGGTK